MALPSWLRPLAARLTRARRGRPNPPPPLRFRPRLEGLEERCLPSLTPHLVAGLDPNSLSSAFTSVNGHVLFFNDDNGTIFEGHRLEEVAADGTAHLLHDFGTDTAYPGFLDPGGKAFYFGVSDPVDHAIDNGLWTSDGTASGTVPVTDVQGNPIGAPFMFITGSRLFFYSFDGDHPAGELWTIEPESGHAILVKAGDNVPGPGFDSNGIFDGGATVINGTLFFTAHNLPNGEEVWKSDGTAAGTVLLKDINTTPVGSDPTRTLGSTPRNLTDVNGKLFFTASDGPFNAPDHFALWVSDGTEAGTVPLKYDPSFGSPQFFAADGESNFTNVNGTLFFTSYPATGGVELWRSDGTAAGTTAIKELAGIGSIGGLMNLNGKLYFSGNDGIHGWELWTSDGTADGTAMVADVNPGAADSNPGNLTAVNGKVFFTADDGIHGNELWVSDGTAAGTSLVTDVNPAGDAFDPNSFAAAAANGKLYFGANDGVHGNELWVSDGTAAGTTLAADINPGPADSNPSGLTAIDGTVYFAADDGVHGNELWELDTNPPPVASVAGPSAGVAGQVLTFTLGATDAAPSAQAGLFTFAVDWGDGSAVQAVTGPASLTVTHAYAAAGIYTATATATDNAGRTGNAATSGPVMVGAETPANLQQQLSPGGTVTVQTATPQQAHDAVAAANGLNAATTPTATVVVDLGGQTIQDTTVNVPPQVTLTFVNGTFVGGSPALIVSSGIVIITNSTFTNATKAPTILVTGGSLILRGNTIQESTGYGSAAIQVTGGSVDLGTAASPGGNTLNINGTGTFVNNTTSTPISAVGDSFTVNGQALTPASLSGIVWEDFNDDGQVDFGENGIRGVTITPTGTDDLGNLVNQSQQTDSAGSYLFLNLRPGNYYLTETQPASYLQGIDSVGTAGGSLVATDRFSVPLAPQANGFNYNYGERPTYTGPVHKGQTAGIGFWNNKNGQALIKSLNGGPSYTQLANWLATTLPDMFGVHAGGANLTGKSNAFVAALFQADFLLKGVKLDAQVLASALNVYVTNATLDSTRVAASYGFSVSGDGAGTATVNVGSNGDAFGVANNATLSLLDLLGAADDLAVNGVLYGGNATLRNHANNVFSALNDAGGIG